jgi:hypothetical protein
LNLDPGSGDMREITHVPFQFLRMISPLAWMPIAVLAFATWDGAIVFLITTEHHSERKWDACRHLYGTY